MAAGLCGAQQRPLLSDAEAARHRVADYLGGWTPQPVTLPARADFVVAADGSGTHRSVQAAIDALPARGAGERRWAIQLRPGTYREVVCAFDKAPFTLFGMPHDAAAVRIVEGRYNALPKRPGREHACDPDPAAAIYGTHGSASVFVQSDDVQLAHLTIANDAMDGVRRGAGYPAGAGESGGAQAVALAAAGERIQLLDVQLVGHQDTFYAARGRIHVSASRIAGDVDFIFGAATLVIERSTVVSRAGRRAPGNGGHVLAPSTPPGQAHGFLVTHSKFDGESGLAPGSISLGRAWDHGVARGAWQAGASPNGQALVRDSDLGAHLGPWAASTSRRPFDAAQNRLFEYRNTQAPDREAAAADDGWGGGTTGGASAAPEDVFDVHDRATLAAALAVGDRPKIVRVHGRIDLSAGLGFDDFRDPSFDPAAFQRAYDPAAWGRQPPAGPQEEARRRSARRQAAQSMLRVPSNTTVIGAEDGAALVHGGLMLEKVDNVIVRHLRFADAYDHFPAWDPKDNDAGEWNSEYDNLSLRGATRVWVDHCSFDDGDRPDDAEPVVFGRRVQHHDGLLDITQQSDRVTLSWNRFARHDKTMLIGSSDGQTADEGRLRVTLHHNLFERVKERTPRVRYGRVHLYNNLYVAESTGPYAFGYSIGVGVRSRIVAQNNAWLTDGDVPATKLLRVLKGTALAEQGSTLDGRPVDLRSGHELAADVGWQPPAVELDTPARVPERVRTGAGPHR